jgi:phage capsid family|nr:MAG TPA: major capsid protein [Caudoviricetes sp.]
MKHDELVKFTKDQLNARLKEIGIQAKTAEGDVLDSLLAEAQDIRDILDQAKKREQLAGIADSADDPEPNEGEKQEQADDGVKAFDKRGKALKAGSGVNFSARIASPNVKASLSVEQTAPVVHTAPDLNQTANPVSALIDMVKAVTLQGGETYERGFVKDYGADGAGKTAEGANYNSVEPVFGYVTIQKEKVTAYTEEPEEMQKLPNADYDSVVEGSVSKAIRRFLSRQILIGDGTTSNLKGIFFNPSDAKERVIDPDTDITSITAIDESTLDEIIYSFGGDEEVEGVATLILNKQDLKAFAKLRDKQGRKVYTIVNQGQTGTIDGVPFVINSACAAISNAATAANSYCMAYGYMQNYELAIFSDIDVRRSDDYKFKSGQTAFRASMFAGGSVAAWNGFVRVKKAGA